MARLQEVVVTEWRVSMWLINWLCSHQPWFIGPFPTNFAPHCIIAYLLLCSQWAMFVSQVLDDFTFGFFSAGLLRSEPTYPVLPLTGAKSSLFWQFSSSVQWQCSSAAHSPVQEHRLGNGDAQCTVHWALLGIQCVLTAEALLEISCAQCTVHWALLGTLYRALYPMRWALLGMHCVLC